MKSLHMTESDVLANSWQKAHRRQFWECCSQQPGFKFLRAKMKVGIV